MRPVLPNRAPGNLKPADVPINRPLAVVRQVVGFHSLTAINPRQFGQRLFHVWCLTAMTCEQLKLHLPKLHQAQFACAHRVRLCLVPERNASLPHAEWQPLLHLFDLAEAQPHRLECSSGGFRAKVPALPRINQIELRFDVTTQVFHRRQYRRLCTLHLHSRVQPAPYVQQQNRYLSNQALTAQNLTLAPHNGCI